VFQKNKLAGELNVAVQISFYGICFSHAGSGTFRLSDVSIIVLSLPFTHNLFEFLALINSCEARAAYDCLQIHLSLQAALNPEA